MTAAFTNCFPVLPVRDVRAAQEFYRDVLGFTIDWRDGEDFGAVSAGAVCLFLARDPDPQAATCVLNATDADAVYERCRAHDVEILAPIATEPWGMREFTMADPNGNRLRIGHVDESRLDASTFVEGPE